jgi:hypothetical protein
LSLSASLSLAHSSSSLFLSALFPPIVVGAHSPDEKMAIATVPDFTQWLYKSVQNLSKVTAAEFDAATAAH